MKQKIALTTILLILLIMAAIGFGIWGWFIDKSVSLDNAAYLSISALFLSDTYLDRTSWQGSIALNIARWSALSAVVVAASKAITILFSNRIKQLQAQRQHNHIIVIGKNKLAYSLITAALKDGYKVIWLDGDLNRENNKKLFIKSNAWSLDDAMKFGVRRCHSITIATEGDAKAIAIARQLRKKIPEEKELTIHVLINSPWLAMRIDLFDGIKAIHLISLAQISIRQIHRKHPPFLIAKKLAHKQIHSVIIGFDLYGEAILIDTLLSSLTTYLHKPIITIVDPDINDIKSNLSIKYPELHKSAELHFIRQDINNKIQSLTEENLQRIVDICPITSVYFCLKDEPISLTAAIAFQSLVLRNGLEIGPIHVRLNSRSAIPVPEAGVFHLKPAQLLSFGDVKYLTNDTAIINGDADVLAIEMHKAYQAVAGQDKSYNIPWEDLNEDIRSSNRRLVMHFGAKLSSAGHDIEGWIRDCDQNPSKESLPHILNFIKRKNLAQTLAELEHERWMADRRINGWQYNSVRDNEKLHHNDLIPFEKLSDNSKQYDLVMIEKLAKILQH